MTQLKVARTEHGMVRLQYDGESMDVSPSVRISWGKHGIWTDTVNKELDWEALLDAECIALRHTLNRKEAALRQVKEIRDDLS
jgi:hypothetical protein